MAVPTISLTSGILGATAGEAFVFQPSASDSPTGWAATGLPEGVSINANSGLISGSANHAGSYVATLTATNGDGDSAPVEFFFGIEGKAETVTAGDDVSTILDVEVVTRTVTGLLKVKRGDFSLVNVRFFRGTTQIDPACTSLIFRCKGLDSEPPFIKSENTSVPVVSGAGAGAVYTFAVDWTGAAVEAFLSDAENDAGTTVNLLGELEWQQERSFNSETVTVIASSATFPVRLDRDLDA